MTTKPFSFDNPQHYLTLLRFDHMDTKAVNSLEVNLNVQ